MMRLALAVQRESSSITIGDLWPKIDSLREADHECTSTTATQRHREDSASRPQPSSKGSKGEGREGAVNAAKKTLLDQAPGPLSAPPKGCGGGFVRSKATQILSDTPRDILPRMKRSFIDRQYSPSAGMDQSEWEIILEQLIHMG
jgi:hypothetical protein